MILKRWRRESLETMRKISSSWGLKVDIDNDINAKIINVVAGLLVEEKGCRRKAARILLSFSLLADLGGEMAWEAMRSYGSAAVRGVRRQSSAPTRRHRRMTPQQKQERKSQAKREEKLEAITDENE
jgi:N-glycosylase/DNA lyase